MQIGQLVMLVGTDGYTPPFGSLGYIHSVIDEVGDYDVEFPKYPCPVAEPTWVCHHTWLMPINKEKDKCTDLELDTTF